MLYSCFIICYSGMCIVLLSVLLTILFLSNNYTQINEVIKKTTLLFTFHYEDCKFFSFAVLSKHGISQHFRRYRLWMWQKKSILSHLKEITWRNLYMIAGSKKVPMALANGPTTQKTTATLHCQPAVDPKRQGCNPQD